eukprot:CAMPEP_0172565832 /NCGR_PEP_ID=MMETSP1067-20121228/109681_1 /TAXON_ID=265564 ORGANISM="Thalassiosira punctigera, Strain Tpunct2005C2" /NCGR_SAMPLE_ID=MMETSP1067 /ASSEMBLY_ACC=CAM_ASM_000444 /LENGTH=33 /DNA_ID= /DNA_START= /DNA_END= /DNA_ORIENTATION=
MTGSDMPQPVKIQPVPSWTHQSRMESRMGLISP